IGNVATALDAVDAVAPHRDLGGGGIGRGAAILQPIREPGDAQVIPVRGLVVDDRNGAAGAGAEGVLDGAVGVASGTDRDVLGALVRGALDLVERSGVRRVERADRAVGGPAGRVGGLVAVARPGWPRAA